MGKVQQRLLRGSVARIAVTVCVATAWLAPLCQAKKFYDDDPMLREPTPVNVTDSRVRQISDLYDFAYHTFGKHPPEGVSLAVNTLGEVPNNAWYTNRQAAGQSSRRMSISELVRGPGDSRPPDQSGRWRIISAKTDGVTPGFQIEDTTGARYLLKLDAAQYPELASAADVIGTKFFYAFGYNTPENYIVRFKREQLTFDDNARFQINGKARGLTKHSLDAMLSGQPLDKDGRYRALASRIISGKV